jgi:hypothetical protein
MTRRPISSASSSAMRRLRKATRETRASFSISTNWEIWGNGNPGRIQADGKPEGGGVCRRRLGPAGQFWGERACGHDNLHDSILVMLWVSVEMRHCGYDNFAWVYDV